MNLDDLIKKVTALEDENVSINKAIASINKKFKHFEGVSSGSLDSTKELKQETNRLLTRLKKLDQLDLTLIQIRGDLNKKIEEVEKKRLDQEKEQNISRQEDIRAINKSLSEVKEELTTDRRMQKFFEEDSKLMKKVMEMEKGFNENLRLDHEYRQQLSTTLDESHRVFKLVSEMQNGFDVMNKRWEDIRNKLDLVSDDLRKSEQRLNDIQSSENRRNQEHSSFMEQQSLLIVERDRVWNDWINRNEESTQTLNALLQDMTNKQQELRQTKSDFDEINQRLNRRINELTETYRITEERLRQDWATFKADEQKHWSNYSVLFGEKQGDFLKQQEDLKNRVTITEDRAKDLQNMLMTISTELQKSMLGLMKMINNWIETFEDISGDVQPKIEP